MEHGSSHVIVEMYTGMELLFSFSAVGFFDLFILPGFLAICSILELEAAIATLCNILELEPFISHRNCSVLVESVGAGSCRFSDNCGIFEFEPLIFYGFCHILLLELFM